jgi:hypothetical protein
LVLRAEIFLVYESGKRGSSLLVSGDDGPEGFAFGKEKDQIPRDLLRLFWQ